VQCRPCHYLYEIDMHRKFDTDPIRDRPTTRNIMREERLSRLVGSVRLFEWLFLTACGLIIVVVGGVTTIWGRISAICQQVAQILSRIH